MSDPWEERRGDNDVRSNDVRSEWERDYARVIHSAAFRRLQSKTQVLGLGESDFYRTRLTHSMEVAQIGVGIVRRLEQNNKHTPEIAKILPRSALMSAICLAHDMGHPPFGHGGEVALNICMRKFGGFEGNGQTLRILSRLDKYTAKDGLNPTRRVLLGVLKYPASYSATENSDAYGDIADRRWLSQASGQHPPKCYMDDESDVVEWILQPLCDMDKDEFVKTQSSDSEHRKPLHKSLDTSIMELADDISYSLHDLEDAISLGMVTREDWTQHNEKNETRFEVCKADLSEMTEDLFSEESYRRKNAIGGLVHKFISNIELRESQISSAKCELIKWNAYMDENHKTLRKHIFELVKKKVIKSCNVQQLEFKGQKLVVELFEALQSDPTRLLPASTLKRYKLTPEGKKNRVICDFIAGMTDEYATRLYEKLYYPHKGSIFDRL